jgi:hypothetical protein
MQITGNQHQVIHCPITGINLSPAQPPVVGIKEEYTTDKMHPLPTGGMIKLSVHTIAFLGHTKDEIIRAIENEYKVTPAPSSDRSGKNLWTWGFYPIVDRNQKYRDVDHDQYATHFVFNRKCGVASITYDGALVDAAEVFQVLNNNKDVMLFVKYVNIVKEEKL